MYNLNEFLLYNLGMLYDIFNIKLDYFKRSYPYKDNCCSYFKYLIWIFYLNYFCTINNNLINFNKFNIKFSNLNKSNCNFQNNFFYLKLLKMYKILKNITYYKYRKENFIKVNLFWMLNYNQDILYNYEKYLCKICIYNRILGINFIDHKILLYIHIIQKSFWLMNCIMYNFHFHHN